MQDRREGSSSSSSSRQRRGQFPSLAPREPPPPSSSTGRHAPTGRPPRLSHRSRAGCWTCRGRKVKCDEVHPRCGPCARLNRECDWDHRWNFSDATASTQGKYGNVNTTGNTVWDPDARPSPSISPVLTQNDDLPAFAVLTTDEDRERKAERRQPGTYSVVVTPESFSQLPEYAEAAFPSSRRTSVQSRRGSGTSPGPSFGRLPLIGDPNTVVLDRFEEAFPSAGPPIAIRPYSPGRRPSFPDAMQHLTISTSTPKASSTIPPAPFVHAVSADDRLVAHFWHYIIRPLIQPLPQGQGQDVTSFSSTSALYSLEAARFLPLHHSLCALSALNLSYRGRASLEDALQHYHQALSTAATPTTPDDLVSDGVFLRHATLFIYDICVPIETDHGGADMWAQHLNHLKFIATQRQERFGSEPRLGYLLFLIIQLDMYAGLLGSGNCDFVRTILELRMLPSLEQQVPGVPPSLPGPYLPSEQNIFPAVLHLNQGVVLQTAKLAQVAHACRQQAGGRPPSPGAYARWQASVAQLQAELHSFWDHSYPDFLPPETAHAGHNLPCRVRYIFEHAFILYQAATIYSRTSIFPGQSLIPTANQAEIHNDTQRRCMSIITLASAVLEANLMERRYVIFPLLMAGIATTQPDAKIQAIDLIKAFEVTGGIGQNTYRTRQLLVAVCEEQRAVVSGGGRMDQVDWLTVARQRGLNVVNCGL